MEQNITTYNKKLAAAGVICGAVGIHLSIWGVPPLILGALGLIFVYLSSPGSVFSNKYTTTGLIVSIIAIIIGLAVFTFSYMILFNPDVQRAFLSIYGEAFEKAYGMSFEDFFSQAINSSSNYYA